MLAWLGAPAEACEALPHAAAEEPPTDEDSQATAVLSCGCWLVPPALVAAAEGAAAVGLVEMLARESSFSALSVDVLVTSSVFGPTSFADGAATTAPAAAAYRFIIPTGGTVVLM